jgi:hypothetical protein|tara:strand:+ start:1671 stop:2030 length:360 start_codon:yes stop_codon:yes gene_type:complete
MTYKVNILKADDSPAETHTFAKKPKYDEMKALLNHNRFEIVDGKYVDYKSGASVMVEIWADEEGLLVNNPQRNHRASMLRWNYFKQMQDQLSDNWEDYAHIYGDAIFVFKENDQVKQNG